MNENDQRLLDSIFGPNGTQEQTHENDCFACDLASQIVGSISAFVHFGTLVQVDRQEHDGWDEPASVDYDEAVPGDTRLDMATRIVAYHLHKKLPGHAPNSPDRRNR